MSSLDTQLINLIGDKTAKKLTSVFGMTTADDLLRHYPRRLAERGELTPIADLRVDDEVTVVAEVRTKKQIPFGNRQVRTVLTIGDGRDTMELVFFGRRASYITDRLQPGVVGLFAGKVGVFNKKRQLAHPEFMLLSGDTEVDPDTFAGALIPVYPATKDIPTWTIANSIAHTLRMLDPIPDPVPELIRARRGLMGLDEALRAMHQPADRDQWWRARRRLTWDEAFDVQVVLAQRRALAAGNPAVARPVRADGLRAAFEEQLPFQLTAGQREVGEVLSEELGLEHPMQRLLQGEVGSGKTVVALRAMLQVVDAGGQAALLAPTEVLAAQHHRSITTMLGDLAQGGMLGGSEFGTTVALLTGSQSASARRRALLDAASGAAGIVVGTHALIQKHVQFADLALVVVDEQHRFGVEQRDALREKGIRPPHVLVMTATPIPRTVAMTVFGDMETSTLRELPRGRSPIATHVVDADRPGWVDRTWQRVAEEVAKGHQAYVVCPRIGDVDDEATPPGSRDTSDEDAGWDDWDAEDEASAPERELTGVYAMLSTLRASPALDGLRIDVLHGRLDADAKDATMRAFTAGEIDVLVATTVIEVGVDVPNASVMVVVDADRFGISQLHQLRGRVGRGSVPGLCLLMTQGAGERAVERLDQVAATNDGFELARADLVLRREGDVLGARQSGRGNSVRHLRLGRVEDEQIIADAREDAFALVADDPELRRHPALAAAVAMRLDDDQAAWLERG